MTRTEIPLEGGNASGGVVRIGDTVRRPAGPWTPAVHALLGHLHAAGFPGAPQPLGLDEHGREVLTFIPGTIPWPDNFRLLGPTAASAVSRGSSATSTTRSPASAHRPSPATTSSPARATAGRGWRIIWVGLR
jgi:hypothetical protein